MTSVEVLAARDLVDGLPAHAFWATSRSTVVRTLTGVAERLAAEEAAKAIAAEAAEKAQQEAAALAAYGGTAAAEDGWNALRQHNPKVDRSTGVYGEAGEVRTFSDLPFKKKLEYAAIAFGVLNPGAKLGSDAPVEPYRFKVGDKVRITGPVQTTTGGICFLQGGEVATVVCPVPDIEGDISVSGKLADGDEVCAQWIDPASLTLVREPREWDSAEKIPVGVKFTDKGNERDDYWVKESDTEYRWHSGGYRQNGWRADVVDGYGPFVEIIGGDSNH
ncbi:hypothetical protein [Rhodococcus sp. NPDC060176]|uniref:hypothetical protein n=1 Tax=Rhodococcus sp. NPDC060176 TaxID=3347062 RepID=UPI00364B9D07